MIRFSRTDIFIFVMSKFEERKWIDVTDCLIIYWELSKNRANKSLHLWSEEISFVEE